MPSAEGGEYKIVLREHLNRKWSRELVTFPFNAAAGECHRDSIAVEGPDGPVAFQFSDVKLWPGDKRFVKSGLISFVVDLAPLAADTYRVVYGTQPAKVEAVPTDLRVERGDGMVELTTGLFGVRLLAGERTYDTPVPASEVPAPLIAMRLADGAWFGGSRMYGPTKIKSYTARLIAEGPVFAEVAFRYVYAG